MICGWIGITQFLLLAAERIERPDETASLVITKDCDAEAADKPAMALEQWIRP